MELLSASHQVSKRIQGILALCIRLLMIIPGCVTVDSSLLNYRLLLIFQKLLSLSLQVLLLLIQQTNFFKALKYHMKQITNRRWISEIFQPQVY
jgi:hypothetical protein